MSQTTRPIVHIFKVRDLGRVVYYGYSPELRGRMDKSESVGNLLEHIIQIERLDGVKPVRHSSTMNMNNASLCMSAIQRHHDALGRS